MKTQLIMLLAVVCFGFTPKSTNIACDDFPLENATRCPFDYIVYWDCNGTVVSNSGTVGAQSSTSVPNPGTNPCCTFIRLALKDCTGNYVSFDPVLNPAGTICDCNGNTGNVSLLQDANGRWYVYIYP